MTKEFKVNPDDMDSTARILWKIAEDNSRAVAYAQEWLQVQSSGGLVLTPVLDQLQMACDELKSNYERLGIVTDSSSTEITKASRMYRTTDFATAKSLDAAYEGADK
ncbi:type VII secretion target [Nocardia cyriacigeorgica]|uniref:type VII secretion target n=1 Tax=Nocardia cyriacigeorgica TaxID=135487 RepID=UPI0024588D7D|nr:type VII secretion target [Nocardia cyriacigeorgica]